MAVKEMTSKEMRNTNPTKDQYADALDLLVKDGWEFVRDRRIPFNGWWINTSHPTKNRPVGDSKNLHFGAWDTLMLYVKD